MIHQGHMILMAYLMKYYANFNGNNNIQISNVHDVNKNGRKQPRIKILDKRYQRLLKEKIFVNQVNLACETN